MTMNSEALKTAAAGVASDSDVPGGGPSPASYPDHTYPGISDTAALNTLPKV